MRHYDILGYEFLGDPGFDATLPFTGIRGIAAIATGMDGGGWTFGLHGFVDTDLIRQNRTYTYKIWDLLGTGDDTATAYHVAGRFQYGGILALGLTF